MQWASDRRSPLNVGPPEAVPLLHSADVCRQRGVPLLVLLQEAPALQGLDEVAHDHVQGGEAVAVEEVALAKLDSNRNDGGN